MDEQRQARDLVERLSEAERSALKSLLVGESIFELARRCEISEVMAANLRKTMKWKLEVLSDADAVRVGLVARLHLCTKSPSDRRAVRR